MSGRVLLYVEDEDAAFVLFETAVRAAKIDVQLHRAADGEQALELLRRTNLDGSIRPDLVVLDLNLPRKNGFEVLTEIKNNDRLRTIKVIVFTSSSLSADKRKSLALGAQSFITKPFSFDSFVEAVKTACSYLPSE